MTWLITYLSVGTVVTLALLANALRDPTTRRQIKVIISASKAAGHAHYLLGSTKAFLQVLWFVLTWPALVLPIIGSALTVLFTEIHRRNQ